MSRYSSNRFAPDTTALVVVDVQNDFCSPDGVIGSRGVDMTAAVEMVPRLVALTEKARAAGVTVVYIQTTHDETVDSDVWNARGGHADFGLPVPAPNCVTGTWGAEFYGVEPKEGDRVVNKHRYSAFAGTDLDLVLRTAGVESLLLTGVATNVCVESTLRDGLFLDYNVALIEDCSATYDPAHQAATVENVDKYFGAVATSDEVSASWSKSPQLA